MKIALLAGSRNYQTVNDKLIKEFNNYFNISKITPIKELKPFIITNKATVYFHNEDLSNYDAIFPRVSSPDVIPAYIIVDTLIDRGLYSPIQPEGILIAKNKFYTLKIAAQSGVPTPKSALIVSSQTVNEVINDFEFPVVVKLLGGAGGKGVILIKTKDEFPPIIEAMERLHQVVAVEEFIPNPGEDHRLFVVGDQVVAAEIRKATKKGEFRANIAVGGKPLPYKPKDEEIEIALNASKAIGLEICGVDILPGTNGFKMIEINDGPGLKGISEVSKKNLYKTIAKYIYERAKQ